MKYFRLTNNISIKEIGRFPQCEEYVKYVSLTNLPKEGKIEDFSSLPECLMLSKAKPSTCISTPITGNFLVIKNYFIKFLSNFKIGEFQSWNLKIHYRKEVLDNYYMFYLPYPKQIDYVDYIKSEFYTRKRKDRNHRDKSIKVKSEENYFNLNEIIYNDGYWLKCDRLVLNLSSTDEDLFRLINIPFGHGYYVSERLKNAIEKERFTGMEFKEIEEYNKKIQVIY